MAQTSVLDIYAPTQYTARGSYIQQQIVRILKTPQGSVPLRPNFGSKLHEMVSYPESRQYEIITECFRALDEGLDFWIEAKAVTVVYSSGRAATVTVTVKDTKEDTETTLTGLRVF